MCEEKYRQINIVARTSVLIFNPVFDPLLIFKKM